ncbi:type II toxin-antitoxin system PemK/MazF family toxin [Bacillus methanolicus]|uniref:Uncharacterized protein n=1 Tax=Bacillus methanolicus (strain MGA3 / ATCC 53907) TaxID=796606 RepID=I3E399_BACMM|nr:type II toxin-antitoxin system PemK/MazF family toxin [Bacillus methanolicus]AIE58942.1 hypothetical protein BMMGA3_02370 [Bacillus methanolicus MGA3]EIJ80970.1 hypothetical protein MGA3_11785 [Bacillus methanolicus MGA3]
MPESDAIKFERKRIRKFEKEMALRAWSKEKDELAKGWIDDEAKQKARKLKQGAIYLCKLGENIGSEMNTDEGGLRPVLVVSNDTINNTADNVAIVPLSKQLKYYLNRKKQKMPRYNSHYFLFKKHYPFLNYDSAVKCEEIRSVSKIRIDRKLGNVEPKVLQKILTCINWVTTGKK